ncbi:MAG: DUF2971 domain-containing protein [Alphaproteobacteria bacterium]|nr:DUF2971 domain-containing protein [Alphaproteobacteria bacterium]
MSLADHIAFRRPADNEGQLWRYMDFLKFVSLINNSAIYLANLEVMSKIDPYEGLLPDGNYAHRKWKSIQDVPSSIVDKIKITRYSTRHQTLEQKIESEKEILDLRIRQSFLYRKSHYVSCWHQNLFESAAMWQAYAQKGFGIAVVSSPSRLESALSTEKRILYLGEVRYEDYKTHQVDIRNGLNSIVTKRNSFNHENEVRLAHWATDLVSRTETMSFQMPNNGNKMEEWVNCQASTPLSEKEIEKVSAPAGIFCQVILAEMIEKVVVSPYEPIWVADEVAGLIRRYGLSIKVEHSSLMTPPPL